MQTQVAEWEQIVVCGVGHRGFLQAPLVTDRKDSTWSSTGLHPREFFWRGNVTTAEGGDPGLARMLSSQ